MSAFYLSVAHSPMPHQVPVGLVAPTGEAATLKADIANGGKFTPRMYATTESMLDAIRDKTIYGGVDVTSQHAHLYIASAAGTTASNTLRTAFTTVIDRRTEQQIAAIAETHTAVPVAVLQRLAAPPAITDVVPLPKNDSVGASIALLVQAIALGATIASIGLGRIGPKTQPSLRRAAGHVVALALYAAASASAVLIAAHIFGVAPSGSSDRLFLTFTLLSLAVTGSVAGLVTLIGTPGALLGSAYFLFGVPIAGASVLPPFMPTLARTVGQALPTGAGVTLVRESLYFPHATAIAPVATLAGYAIVGVALIIAGNAIAQRSGRRQILRLPLRASALDSCRQNNPAT